MDTKKLRQKILDLAIHGKLVPQDPNDEPASVLLERISNEKERLIKEGKIKRSKQTASSDLSSDDVPFELPEGWCWCIVDDFAYVAAGSTPSKDSFVDDGIPYIKMYNLRNQIIDFEYHPQYIKKEVHNGKLQRSRTEIGDLIMNIVGPPLGKLAFIPESLPESNFNQAAVLIRPFLHKDIINIWLFYYLSEMSEINSISTKGSAGQVNISLTQSQNMRIPLPPLAEQKRIVSAVEQRMSVIDVLENNEEDLRQSIDKAKSKILDLAIRGKLVPQDSNDEPASELLKRLGISPDNCPCEDLPNGWTAAYLSELCTNINGLWKGKKEPFVNIGIIRNANFTKDFKLDYSNIEYLDVEEKSFSKRSLNNGDLIVEKSGGSDKNPVGRAVLYEGEDGKYSFSNFTMALRVRNFNVISSKYLYYFILNMYKLGAMSSMQTQTTGLHNLILDKYLAIEVSLPPLAEQHRIVAKIEQLYSQLDEIESSLQ